MRVFLTLFISIVIFFNTALGQTNTYALKARKAFSYYESKEFKKSAQLYQALFANAQSIKMWDRYNAACSWALAGEVDNAFIQLHYAVSDSKFTNLSHIKQDKDLASLHADKRWQGIIDQVSLNKKNAEANYDHELIAVLSEILQTDQGTRKQIRGIEKEHGWESKEMKALMKQMRKNDSINELKVIGILDERGWLGKDVIGQNGNLTLFLVIQHADLKVQQKYLPMMRQAVTNGNAQASSLALLEDRVALRTGKPQVYGSQVGQNPDTKKYEVQPMIDPRNVNVRRAKVGLGTIEEYIAHWELEWDIEDYMTKLPELKKRYKVE